MPGEASPKQGAPPGINRCLEPPTWPYGHAVNRRESWLSQGVGDGLRTSVFTRPQETVNSGVVNHWAECGHYIMMCVIATWLAYLAERPIHALPESAHPYDLF